MFLLKNVPYPQKYLKLYSRVSSCPYVRPIHDTVSEPSMFMFQYRSSHLLEFVNRNLSLALTKRILKDTLRGLAALHDQNIVHNGESDSFDAERSEWMINMGQM